VSKYIGLPGEDAYLMGGPPWARQYGTHCCAEFDMNEADKNQTGVLANPSMSKIVDWFDGEYQTTGRANGQGEGEFSSNAPYVWDSTTGQQIDRWPSNAGVVAGGEEFKGKTAASADLTHFVFSSNVVFSPEGLPGDVYDNDTDTGAIKVVSLAEDGSNLTSLTPLKVSENGSHILMTTGEGLCSGVQQTATSCGSGELYMRVADTSSYAIAPDHSVNFIGMTADGSEVYFTSTQKLIPADLDTSNDLYMWSAEKAERHEPPLTLVSVGDHGTAGNVDGCSASWTTKCSIVPIVFTDPATAGYTDLQGGLGGNGVSDSYIAAKSGDIYFYSPEQLDGVKGVPNSQNLFVYRNGQVQFVASLTPGHVCTEDQFSPICSNGPVARMDVSPDGRHMAFITASQLTSYESDGHTEMYSYEPETGSLICVSCVPDGEAPTYDVFGSLNGLFMADDGRTFFFTEQALVPRDTNRSEDVYEFVEGRPQLITTGIGAGYATAFGIIGVVTSPGLVGVSANGTDAYFATYEHLVGQDENGQELKIYDARSGGGFPFSAPLPGCAAADECHGAGSSAPSPLTAGSGAELGSRGNAQSSPRHRRKKHHTKAEHRRRSIHHGMPRHLQAPHQRGVGRNG
jgi:hypothetical protein